MQTLGDAFSVARYLIVPQVARPSSMQQSRSRLLALPEELLLDIVSRASATGTLTSPPVNYLIPDENLCKRHRASTIARLSANRQLRRLATATWFETHRYGVAISLSKGDIEVTGDFILTELFRSEGRKLYIAIDLYESWDAGYEDYKQSMADFRQFLRIFAELRDVQIKLCPIEKYYTGEMMEEARHELVKALETVAGERLGEEKKLTYSVEYCDHWDTDRVQPIDGMDNWSAAISSSSVVSA